MIIYQLNTFKKNKMKKIISSLLFSFFLFGLNNMAIAQLYVNGGSIIIDSGSTVSVKGDLISNTDLVGAGKIILNGTTGQNLNMNGYSIPNIEVNNSQNISLLSNVKIKDSLIFVAGKIIAGNYDLNLNATTITNGMGTSKFVETNGIGQVNVELSQNISSKEIPIGISTIYRPVFATTTATSYNTAKIGARVVAEVNPSIPSGLTDYLKVYWPITQIGINGTLNVSAQYTDPTDITGTESKLKGFYYNGTQWTSQNSSTDFVLNRIAASIISNNGSLYGMNFSPITILRIKAFLQGFYNSNGNMYPALNNLSMSTDSTAADSLTINLWSSNSLNNSTPNFSYKTILNSNGIALLTLPNSLNGNSYYIALKHRNSIETWSSNPVLFSDSTNYDFSTAANKAFSDGNNIPMMNLGNGTYAIYTGDINQDGTADATDLQITENDAYNFQYGYNTSDCNVDGASDAIDMQLIENNTSLFLFMARP